MEQYLTFLDKLKKAGCETERIKVVEAFANKIRQEAYYSAVRRLKKIKGI